MATSVIRSSVVSTSAGRRNICDCLAKESSGLGTLPLKSQSYSHLGGCACLRCHYLAKEVIVTSTTNFSDDTLPVEHKHHPLSAISLGTLSTKESPIFVRRQHLILPQEEQQPPAPVISSPPFSLRSASPSYIERQPEIDLCAVEALPLASDIPAPTRTSMDINRNNGYLHNGAIMTSTSEKREHLYKILVIGELGTGKTSFIKRYVHQFFSQNYRATIGVDFALKVLQWDGNTIVRLQLWDIAGQERFGNMTRVYYKEAVGAFIVFDVTRSGTFDCVSKWKEDLDSKVQLPDGSPIPCILLANKCDQEKQGIITNPEKMDEYVRENGFAGWFETSAKENINIDEASRALVNKILINDKLITGDLADGDKFNLNSTSDATGTETKNKCSC
ncbi:ras-related protein Rab-32 isoform X2 [Drosophila pseudoobscura]|uniref:Ras-related protein Rab n=1 Tax=Drosophila pseudoobscura pseudoobscura TaxID=46245 RepID=A0A6I8V6R0_DROPS|nr:ras-related protein Rab-32 isoform X2 [Drosophila pseudoobscura]